MVKPQFGYFLVTMTKKSAEKLKKEKFIDQIRQAQQEVRDGKVFTGDLDELAKKMDLEDRKENRFRS